MLQRLGFVDQLVLLTIWFIPAMELPEFFHSRVLASLIIKIVFHFIRLIDSSDSLIFVNSFVELVFVLGLFLLFLRHCVPILMYDML